MCNLKIYPILSEKKVVSKINSVFTETGKYRVETSLKDANDLGIPRRLTGV